MNNRVVGKHSRHLVDLTGRKYGRLTVLEQAEKKSPRGQIYWRCLCDCGKETVVLGSNLQAKGPNHVISCGCAQKEHQAILAETYLVTHGMARRGKAKTREYSILTGARGRAKERGIPCTITIGDIVIPDLCPVLGIPPNRNLSRLSDNSPTLDRIRPEEGYIPENIAIISWRANKVKCDATLEELEKITAYVRERNQKCLSKQL